MLEIYCSADFAEEIHSQLRYLSVINILLSITAFLGNSLILVALRKESSLNSPSKLLLQSLAATDLCVGLISEPLLAIFELSLMNERWSLCVFSAFASAITGYTFSGATLLTMTAISVDRLLALLLGLRYRQVVTLNRTYVIVFTLWLLPAVFSAMYLWNPLITLWYGIINIPLCLIISVSSYTKIFLSLRYHQNQVRDRVQQPNQTNQLNIARYKMAVFSAIWLQLTLVACYLPYSIVEALRAKSGLSESLYLAWIYTATLVFLNSSLNPILFCWKLDEIRKAVKDTIRQVLCLRFSS